MKHYPISSADMWPCEVYSGKQGETGKTCVISGGRLTREENYTPPFPFFWWLESDVMSGCEQPFWPLRQTWMVDLILELSMNWGLPTLNSKYIKTRNNKC